ncbi:MAG: hypothetical protein AAF984_06635 [Verrucomicrobiota bacterium]
MLVVLGHFTSCTTNSRRSSIDTVKSIGYQKILAEASILRENVHHDTLVVSFQKWPDSFQLLNPLQVHYHSHGFKLLMTKFIGQEQGLFVITEQNFHIPDLPEVTYESISKGIYWYEDYRE